MRHQIQLFSLSCISWVRSHGRKNQGMVEVGCPVLYANCYTVHEIWYRGDVSLTRINSMPYVCRCFDFLGFKRGWCVELDWTLATKFLVAKSVFSCSLDSINIGQNASFEFEIRKFTVHFKLYATTLFMANKYYELYLIKISLKKTLQTPIHFLHFAIYFHTLLYIFSTLLES